MASTRRAPPDCVAGAAAFRAQLEGAQPGLFAMILRGVWADNCSYVQGELPRKAVCISATKLLCETDLITDAACFGTMLQSLLTMVLVDQGMEAAPPADAATQEIPDLEQESALALDVLAGARRVGGDLHDALDRRGGRHRHRDAPALQREHGRA